ncbi:MAG: RNA 2'-phosphotransferase [Clostridium sp.]|nr:RNA 2'-phosphotransferase [Clostridium sp.]
MHSNDVRLGKFISLILRNKPEVIGISLDKHGWADVDELIKGINKSGRKIDFETLDRIVRENNKQRYSFNDDKTKIRANQGHSINVDVELKEVIPPDVLYHGTATRFLYSIKDKGILKMSRLYVHLSKDVDTALNVGKRHGKPIVLAIDTGAMIKDSYKFYLSVNDVYLCDDIPWKYVRIYK